MLGACGTPGRQTDSGKVKGKHRGGNGKGGNGKRRNGDGGRAEDKDNCREPIRDKKDEQYIGFIYIKINVVEKFDCTKPPKVSVWKCVDVIRMKINQMTCMKK